jgi:hypothetical protein
MLIGIHIKIYLKLKHYLLKQQKSRFHGTFYIAGNFYIFLNQLNKYYENCNNLYYIAQKLYQCFFFCKSKYKTSNNL